MEPPFSIGDEHVLITGVCGTVGRELLRQVVALGPARVIGIDNNESEMFFLGQEYAASRNVRLFLCDLRDPAGLHQKMADIGVVLHAAALKHVILCEESPRDAIQTNIVGTQNVIDVAQARGVRRVVFTSSDKAVNPTNVMGTSKLMGERLITAANAHRRRGDPIFFSTRFGNVLGSRGSVIPLFRKQILAGGPVTLTDEAMTRFIMTLEEAVGLVLRSLALARGGEVFVTKMPIVRIRDLAEVLVAELSGRRGVDPGTIKIRVTGVKAGEKLYEELVSDEELRRTWEMENFFVVLPAFRGVYEPIDYDYPGVVSRKVDRPFNSSAGTVLDRETLRRYLLRHGLLDGD